MPNYIYNHLTIHNLDNHEDFLKKHMRLYVNQDNLTDFDLNTIIPQPQDIEEEVLRGVFIADEYTWRIRHWGCRSNASSTEVIDNDEALIIEFLTPWSPISSEILETLSKMYPNATFEHNYSDGTGAQEGFSEYKNGIVITQCQYDEGSYEAYEHAFEYGYADRDEYEYDEENCTYHYKED